MEISEKLEVLKSIDKFPSMHWEEREFEPSTVEIVVKMNKEVDRFIDFLILILRTETNLESYVQGYLDAWDDAPFNIEETEYITELMCSVMNLAGVDPKGMMI